MWYWSTGRMFQLSRRPFKVYHNPLINWLWIGSVIFVLGYLVAYGRRRKRNGKLEAGSENERGEGRRGFMKTKNFVSLAFCFLTIALSILPITVVSAQKPTPSDDEVNAIARQLFCPICQNIPLDVCPTQACADWRETHPPDAGRGQDTE